MLAIAYILGGAAAFLLSVAFVAAWAMGGE
jgi:hypothetical protein